MAGFQTTEEQVEIRLGLDAEQAHEQIRNYVAAFEKDYKRLEQITKRSNRKFSKMDKDFWRQRQTIARLEQGYQQKNLDLSAKMVALNTDLKTKERLLAAARRTGAADMVVSIEQQIRAIQGLRDEYQQAQDDLEEQRKQIENIKKGDINFKGEPIEWGKDIGEGLGEAFTAVMSKDVGGVGEGIAKAFVALSQKGLRKIGGALADKGAAWQKRGQEITARNQGGYSAAGGKGLQAIGGLLQKVGPLIQALGQIGPALGIIGGGLMSIVKLLIDAEAGAKEFQKSILSSASTLEVLQANGGQAQDAFVSLEDTLRGVRDAAFDLSNVSWGLNKEDYTSTMNALTSTGYTLQQLRKDAGGTVEGIQKLTTETVHLAVGYSRTMGVSLGEVTAMQGELMGQLGMNLEQVRRAFGAVALETRESGTSANQFFAIIRGMSADMSLFNNRMDMAAKVLGKLTKVMDPRKAGEFLQSIQGYFKGQDAMSRVRSVKMGGAGSKGNLQLGQNRKVEGLSKDLQSKGIDPDALKNAISAGTKEATKFIAENGKELSADEKGAILAAAKNQERVTRGGVGDLAAALKDQDVVGSIRQIQLMSMNVLGRPVQDLTDIQTLAAEGVLNLTQEQQDQFGKLISSLDITKAEIAKRIEEGNATSSDLALLEKLGIKTDDKKKAAATLLAKDSVTVLENMEQSDRQALDGMKAQETLAEKQAALQTSLMEKIQAILDWLMNQMYNVLTSIMESVMSLADRFSVGDSKSRDWEKTQTKIAKSGNLELSKIAASSTSAEEFKSKAFESRLGQGQEKILLESAADRAKIEKEIAEKQAVINSKTASAIEKKKAEEGISALTKQTETVDKAFSAVANSIDEQIMARGSTPGMGVESVQSALRAAVKASGVGIDATKEETLKKFETTMRENAISGKGDPVPSVLRMLSSSGFSSEETAKIMGQLQHQLTPEELGKQMATASKDAQVEALTASKLPDFAEAGLKKGSIYTHDAHAEPLLEGILDAVGGNTGAAPEEATVDPLLELLESSNYNGEALDSLYDALRIKGIKLAKSHLESDIAKVIENSTLKAIQDGLFEYYLYKDLSPEQLKGEMEKGGYGRAGDYAKKEIWDKIGVANARGGSILGMNPDGTAKVIRPPAGEYPAFVGAGEKIVPGGGAGGSNVNVNVQLQMQGDLKRMIEVVSQQTVVDHMRASMTR